MKAYIQLGEGYTLSPAAYLNGLRMAMDNPTASFKQSFQDPRGWMGGHTGASIVQEYRRMIRDRHADQWAKVHTCGKGSAANRRVRHIRNAHAECKWCGQKTGSTAKRFCEASCARSYNN